VGMNGDLPAECGECEFSVSCENCGRTRLDYMTSGFICPSCSDSASGTYWGCTIENCVLGTYFSNGGGATVFATCSTCNGTGICSCQ